MKRGEHNTLLDRGVEALGEFGSIVDGDPVVEQSRQIGSIDFARY